MTSVPEKWVRTFTDRLAIDQGCYFDEQAAQRVVYFFENYLIHFKGDDAGKPFILQDYQKYDILMPLFGWMLPDGTRRYRNAYIEIGKKNGKSALGSGICLYLFDADGEAGAEVYNAAADRDQAAIIFDVAAAMVEASPALSKRLKVIRSTKHIVNRATHSKYKALSRVASTKEGYNIHGLVFDELHAQVNRDLWDALSHGGANRKQPLFVSITTAGWDRTSICWEQHEYARRILENDEGLVDTSFFAYIAGADIDDDWEDPEVWKKANPSLGVTVFMDELKQKYLVAKESASAENTFRRYRLNQWTEQETRWLNMERWDECGQAESMPDLTGRECYIGVDLSATTDITAVVAVFPEPDSDNLHVLPFFFVPEENIHKRQTKDHVPYLNWKKQGYIVATGGDYIDQSAVINKVIELSEKYQVLSVAVDPWNGAGVISALSKAELPVFSFRQGMYSYSAPTKRFEELVGKGKIQHYNNPVLRWMARNVTVIHDTNENMMPSKKKSTERIDGITSIIMALGQHMVYADENESAYNDDSVEIFSV